METKIFKISPDAPECEELSFAAEVIKSGGLVVFPTETVYGLGADATNSDAARRIYEAKGRPSDNPLIIHIEKPEDAEEYAYTSPLYYRLAEAFMPGPITVVMRSKETVPPATRGGLDTVAVRCPENPIARALVALSGVPIAAPSANISGSPSPTTAQHVIDDMSGRCEVIIDGGDCDFGLESTIVKLDGDNSLTLLCPGKITVEDFIAMGIEVSVASAVTGALNAGEVALSPGMKYRHYAPSCSFILLDGDIEQCIEYIKRDESRGRAFIAYDEYTELASRELSGVDIYSFGRMCDTERQAHLLFNILRDADKKSYDVIYAPTPKTDGIGLALYNRMIRAAAHKIIKL